MAESSRLLDATSLIPPAYRDTKLPILSLPRALLPVLLQELIHDQKLSRVQAVDLAELSMVI